MVIGVFYSWILVDDLNMQTGFFQAFTDSRLFRRFP